MKRIALCLVATALASAGCFGVGGQGDMRAQKAPQTELVSSTAPVKAADVKAQNIRDVLRALEREIARDEAATNDE